MLGANRDAEPNGQPTANANGDDNNGVPDDEDGVTFTSTLINGTAATVSVVVSQTCKLNAWIDFNHDGDWADAGEQIFTDKPMTAGLNTLTFNVPNTAIAGASFARFRVNTAGGLSYTGQASDGEVEDYKVQLYSRVAGRNLFYNQSGFDGNNAAANASDDGAIATDKTALLPGGTATFGNYTSYLKGINGIMIDVAGLAGTPDLSYFQFKVGNTNTPTGWDNVPAPASITVRAGAGVGGTDRITIIWANNAIQNKWLQVTVLSAAGLATSDVHYWGNQIGETGNVATNTWVDAGDASAVQSHYSGLGNVPVTSPYDINRDKVVNAGDCSAVRSHYTGFGSTLILLAPPASLLGASSGVSLGSSKMSLLGVPTLTSAPVASPLAVDFVHAKPITLEASKAATRLDTEVPALAAVLAKPLSIGAHARAMASSIDWIGDASPLGTALETHLLLDLLATVRH
jgi:hypothetical protein